MKPDYHKFSEMQGGAAIKISSLVPSFLSNLSWLEKEEGPVVIVEYGCADGGNSQIPVRDIIKRLFELKGKEIPVHVVHNDLPSSNFSFLFSLVENSQQSYKQEFGKNSQICCFASGSSFYNQIISSGSASLAFSSSAFHWIKQRHFRLQSDTLLHYDAQPEENIRWVKASIENLKEIFELRINELRLGGRLLVSHASYSPNHRPPVSQLLRRIDKILFEELVDRDHKLTREEARACTIPLGILPFSEVLSIFSDGLFFPEHSSFGFKLLQSDTNPTPDPYFEQFKKGVISLDEYSDTLCRSIRAWFEVAFKSGLPDSVNKEDIVETLFSRLTEEIRKNPEALKGDCFHVYLILEKIQKS